MDHDVSVEITSALVQPRAACGPSGIVKMDRRPNPVLTPPCPSVREHSTRRAETAPSLHVGPIHSYISYGTTACRLTRGTLAFRPHRSSIRHFQRRIGIDNTNRVAVIRHSSFPDKADCRAVTRNSKSGRRWSRFGGMYSLSRNTGPCLH